MRISDWSSDVCSSDLSPGLDFETKIIAKPEAAQLLRRELARKAYKPESIALGTNTDPYQPVERRLKITRSILEVLKETRHPRSEEHTSELQSLMRTSYAVFCLTKKQRTYTTTHTH